MDPTVDPNEGRGVFCSRCGRELNGWDVQQGFHVHTYLGYGSIHDGQEIDYRLCSDCIDEVIEECRLSPVFKPV